MRAMILAAGHGTRLRPLTELIPKPLIPMLDRPLLRYHLEMLKGVGVTDVMINLHHLGEMIPAALGDGEHLGIRCHYIREPELLGTGGGVRNVRDFLTARPGPFLLLNGDLLSEASLERALACHRGSAATATMVLRADPAAQSFGAIGVDGQDRILDFVGRARRPGPIARWGLFTGIHILEQEVLDLIPEGPVCINQTAYPRMIRDGYHVQAIFDQGYWSDVGTPQRYLEAHMALLNGAFHPLGCSPLDRLSLHLRTNPDHDGPGIPLLPAGTSLEAPCALGERVHLEAGAHIGPGVFIGRGARVGARTRLSNTVVWSGVHIPAGLTVSDAILWGNEGEECRILPVPVRGLQSLKP